MHKNKLEIKRVTDKKYESRIDFLFADAFIYDPAFIWLYPNEEKVKTPFLTEIFFDLGVAHKHMYIADDPIKACAIWVAPGEEISIKDLYKAGFFGCLWKLGLKGAYNTLKIFLKNEKYKKQFVPDTCWYLFAVAVDESLCGQGIGEEILKPVLEQADKEGVICYAETSNSKTLNFYKKIGFEVVLEENISNNPESPPIFYIKRQPKTVVSK